MELQIQDLVETIKKDGVQEAEKKSAEIISDAQKEAARIIADAKKEAASLIEDAKHSNEVLARSTEASLQQAARDVRISLKKELGDEMSAILNTEVGKALSAEETALLIKEVVKGEKLSEKAVEVSGKLAESLASSLAAEIKAGLEIRPVRDVKAGFRIKDKDGSGFYDLSDDEIAAMMKPFLSSAINAILEK